MDFISKRIFSSHIGQNPLQNFGDVYKRQQVAQTTAGFTGADLENLLNEAAIMAAKEGRVYIQQSDIRHAFVKVGIGAEKKSRVISDKEKRLSLIHIFSQSAAKQGENFFSKLFK